MLKKLFQIMLLSAVLCSLSACVVRAVRVNPAILKGQYYFDAGYYKSAMRQLMPAAIEGDPHAQYAVGYMYYYGYGVAQDTDMGYFWMRKSAARGFPLARVALSMIGKHEEKDEAAERHFEIKNEKLKAEGVGPRI